ncbi:mannose-6-phosphate isomerase, class I [Georgenia sp. Marseille-Q6866]
MRRVLGVPRDYAWGSPSAIHRLMGTEPDGTPLAELWFGAHPSGPARAADGAGDVLGLIEADPAGTLGRDVLARFGAQLPYLLKLIAPRRPLSLQVHPDLERARARFAAENRAGVPLDAPWRNYRDANHKPELVFALTTFEAVSGFRAPRRAAELLADLDAPLTRSLHAALVADPTPSGMRTAFTSLLDPATRPSAREVADVVDACRRRAADGSPSPRADAIVGRLAEEHPHDPGVVASLLLNPVTLQPGDSLFVPAGGVHAYLSGLGVEIMASSDNVLRAGLTSKHVDVGEVLDCVDYVAAPPIRVAPEVFHGATRVFYAPVDDFELSVTTLADGDCADGARPLPGRGPRMLLCLQGEMEVAAASGALRLRHGDAAFVRADDGPLTVHGPGTLFQADVP